MHNARCSKHNRRLGWVVNTRAKGPKIRLIGLMGVNWRGVAGKEFKGFRVGVRGDGTSAARASVIMQHAWVVGNWQWLTTGVIVY